MSQVYSSEQYVPVSEHRVVSTQRLFTYSCVHLRNSVLILVFALSLPLQTLLIDFHYVIWHRRMDGSIEYKPGT